MKLPPTVTQEGAMLTDNVFRKLLLELEDAAVAWQCKWLTIPYLSQKLYLDDIDPPLEHCPPEDGINKFMTTHSVSRLVRQYFPDIE